MPTSRRFAELASILLALVLSAAVARAAPLTNLTFVVFDVETTGFSRALDRIVEIGAVRIKPNRKLERKNWLVHPGMRIPGIAVRIHGITDDMVADAPTFAAVYPEFVAFAGDSVLLAHNATFDVALVAAEVERASLTPLQNPVLDTLRLSRRFVPDAPSHSLSELVRYLGIPDGRFHRGADDAWHTAELFLKIRQRLPDGTTLEELMESGVGMKFPPATPASTPKP